MATVRTVDEVVVWTGALVDVVLLCREVVVDDLELDSRSASFAHPARAARAVRRATPRSTRNALQDARLAQALDRRGERVEERQVAELRMMDPPRVLGLPIE